MGQVLITHEAIWFSYKVIIPTRQIGKPRLRVTRATNDSWAREQAVCCVTSHRRRTKVQLGSSGLCSSCNTSRQGECAWGAVLVCLTDECPGAHGKKLLSWSPKPLSAGCLQALVLITSGLSGNNKSYFLELCSNHLCKTARIFCFKKDIKFQQKKLKKKNG